MEPRRGCPERSVAFGPEPSRGEDTREAACAAATPHPAEMAQQRLISSSPRSARSGPTMAPVFARCNVISQRSRKGFRVNGGIVIKNKYGARLSPVANANDLYPIELLHQLRRQQLPAGRRKDFNTKHILKRYLVEGVVQLTDDQSTIRQVEEDLGLVRRFLSPELGRGQQILAPIRCNEARENDFPGLCQTCVRCVLFRQRRPRCLLPPH
jgi:hypothetical protein